MTAIKDLGRGIRRHPWKTVGYIFTAFSVLFTIIKGVTYFVPGVEIEGPIALSIVVLVSIGFGLNKVWKPSRIVEQAVDTYEIPIIAAYPDYGPILEPAKFLPLWPKALADRINDPDGKGHSHPFQESAALGCDKSIQPHKTAQHCAELLRAQRLPTMGAALLRRPMSFSESVVEEAALVWLA